jgi:hypothetical protein
MVWAAARVALTAAYREVVPFLEEETTREV